MSNCPCCSNVLLRHVRSNQVYWFCRNCWEVMPAFDEKYVSSRVTLLETRKKQEKWEIYSAG